MGAGVREDHQGQVNSKWWQVTVKQCHAPTNEATKEANYDFYEVL